MQTKTTILAQLQEKHVPEPDKDILADYLVQLDGQSKHSYLSFNTHISEFYTFIEYRSITEIKVQDITAYFDYLMSRNLSEKSRWIYSYVVKTWFNHAIKQLFARNGMTMINPFDYVDMPFSNKPQSQIQSNSMKVEIVMDAASSNKKTITDDDMEKILRGARLRSQRLYVLVLILKYTGMRISEAQTIRLENIDFQERIIATGIVKDHKKSELVFFVVPEHVITEIQDYILGLNDGEEWLFPSTVLDSFATCIIKEVERLSKHLGIKFTSHWFRHTLVTKRHKMGCPPHVNEFLQNHEVTGNQGKYYRERNLTLRDRRELYDKWNPWD